MKGSSLKKLVCLNFRLAETCGVQSSLLIVKVMAFSIMKWWHHFHVLTIKSTFAGSMVSTKVYHCKIYTMFHLFFIHLLPVWSFREKFYHLLPVWIREKVWRCPITGDYFTALSDSEVPWVICQCSFANILVMGHVILHDPVAAFLWFYDPFWGGDSLHKTSRRCKTGSWLRRGCLHRAFRRIIRCLRGSVWHPVVVFLAWNLKSLKCLQIDWIGWLHVITIWGIFQLDSAELHGSA